MQGYLVTAVDEDGVVICKTAAIAADPNEACEQAMPVLAKLYPDKKVGMLFATPIVDNDTPIRVETVPKPEPVVVHEPVIEPEPEPVVEDIVIPEIAEPAVEGSDFEFNTVDPVPSDEVEIDPAE